MARSARKGGGRPTARSTSTACFPSPRPSRQRPSVCGAGGPPLAGGKARGHLSGPLPRKPERKPAQGRHLQPTDHELRPRKRDLRPGGRKSRLDLRLPAPRFPVCARHDVSVQHARHQHARRHPAQKDRHGADRVPGAATPRAPGIENARCLRLADGVERGGAGYFLSTEDMARFAQFYLQRGVWEGKRLLQESWFDRAAPRRLRPSTRSSRTTTPTGGSAMGSRCGAASRRASTAWTARSGSSA